MIGLINYGCGNIASIQNMLASIGYDSSVVNSPEGIDNCDLIFLPGVGAFDRAMSYLRQDDWVSKLDKYVKSGRPIVGICLGMQILGYGSDEGGLEGLGYVPGFSKKFDCTLPVPHMGWNAVDFKSGNFEFNERMRFYFVHSYHFEPVHNDYILGKTLYEKEFVSAIIKENVIGVQFHPEKSHYFGKLFFQKLLSEYYV